MRGYDMISELYRGNLRPCDRRFRNDTPYGAMMVMESVSDSVTALSEL